MPRDAAVYIGSNYRFVSKTDVWESAPLGETGSAIVYSGGAANAITLDNACMTIYNGGTAAAVILNGGASAYVAGGAMTDATVNSGGVLFVESGGLASGAILHDDANVIVSS